MLMKPCKTCGTEIDAKPFAMARHVKAVHPRAAAATKAPAAPSVAIDPALKAILEGLAAAQVQNQQVLVAFASQQENVQRAVIGLASQVKALNDMILEARAQAQGQAQAPATGQDGQAPQAQASGLKLNDLVALAQTLGIGAKANPGGGLIAALNEVMPVFNLLQQQRIVGGQEVADIFSRSVRAGLTPEQTVKGIETSLKEQRMTLAGEASTPVKP